MLRLFLAAVLLGTTLTTYTQPTSIQTKSATASSASSVSITFAQAPTAGDVELCSASHTAGSGASFTFPAGFTVTSAGQTNISTTLATERAYHVVAGGDPSTLSLSTSVSVGALVFGCAEYAYVNTSTPIMADSCSSVPSPGTMITGPAMQPTLPTVATSLFAALGTLTDTPQAGVTNFDTAAGTLNVRDQHSTPIYAFQTQFTSSLVYNVAPTSAIACTTLLNPTVTPFTVVAVAPVSTPTPAPTAAPTSPPFGSAPTHVMTAEYLWSTAERNTANYSTYAPYLTYAYPGAYSALTAMHNAGFKNVIYTDPWQPSAISTQDPTEYGLITTAQGTAYQNAMATPCGSATEITTYSGKYRLANVLASYNNGTYTVQNAAAFVSADLNAYVNSVKTANSGVDRTDVFFTDNASDYGASAVPCGVSTTRTATWAQGIADTVTAAAPPHHVFVNSLGYWGTAWIAAQLNTENSSYVDGAMSEACYGGHGYGSTVTGDFVDGTDKLWYYQEQAEIGTILKSKIFWCYNENTSDGATRLDARLYMYASFLLTYNPAYAIFQTAMTTTPSTFKVFPETGFVPMSPAVTNITGISQLKASTGLYEQRYSACYYRGSLVSGCAIDVNPSPTSTYAVPNVGSYTRTAVLSGDGVLDGGKMTFYGPQVSTLGPLQAAIRLP